MSQNEAILQYLKSGGSLTALTAANEFSCMRLAARIADLKSQGHDIADCWIEKNDKRFKNYFLKQPQQMNMEF
jgi:hypothetical protein